jgi:uncharacterized protein YgiM (DUF1202 family)
MSENKATLRRTCFSRSRSQAHRPSFVALTLCLLLASSLLGGCAVGAVVGLMTAVTEVGILTETALEAALERDEPESVIVKKETDVYAGPGEEYERIATLNEGAEILVLGYQGFWIECQCDECEDGWIRCPCAPDR